MRFAAMIENTSGAWQLTFPDAPGYVKTASVANTLLRGIEDRLFEALHQYITTAGDLPTPAYEGGVTIQVRPVDAVRLAVSRGLRVRNAATPESAAALLDISAKEAERVLDAREWIDVNSLFRHLERLGILCDMTFSDSGVEAPQTTNRPLAKKRGRPKAAASRK